MTVIQATILNYALIKSKSCPRLGISPYANSCKEMLVLLASKQKCVLSEGAWWMFYQAAAGLDALFHFASQNNQSMS